MAVATATKPAPTRAPAPTTAPSTDEDARNKLFDDISIILEKALPDVIDGAKNGLKEELKRKLSQMQAAIEKDKLGAIAEIQTQVTAFLKEIDTKGGDVLVSFIDKLDDWAAGLGADPAIVAGLKALGSDETKAFIKQMVEGMVALRLGERKITMDYRTLFVGMMGLLVASFIAGLYMGSLIWG